MAGLGISVLSSRGFGPALDSGCPGWLQNLSKIGHFSLQNGQKTLNFMVFHGFRDFGSWIWGSGTQNPWFFIDFHGF